MVEQGERLFQITEAETGTSEKRLRVRGWVGGATPLAVREDFLEEREAESSGSRQYVLSILP